MKRRIGLMLMAALMVAAMLVPASPAQAQQEFRVVCILTDIFGDVVGCKGSTPPFLGEEFECTDPSGLALLDPSQCTREATGQTFDCFITGFSFAGIMTAAAHRCTIPESPPGTDGGGGGGQQGGGGGQQGGGAAPLEITQESEQEAESGDIDQSFTVTSEGDNSTQCANAQGVSNTGNPQNVIDLLQAASDADDFEFDEVGSDITVSPESPTTCDQQVNQAASASG